MRHKAESGLLKQRRRGGKGSKARTPPPNPATARVCPSAHSSAVYCPIYMIRPLNPPGLSVETLQGSAWLPCARAFPFLGQGQSGHPEPNQTFAKVSQQLQQAYGSRLMLPDSLCHNALPLQMEIMLRSETHSFSLVWRLEHRLGSSWPASGQGQFHLTSLGLSFPTCK